MNCAAGRCKTWFYLLRRAFPDMCLPLGIGVDNVKGHVIPIFIGIVRLVFNKSEGSTAVVSYGVYQTKPAISLILQLQLLHI